MVAAASLILWRNNDTWRTSSEAIFLRRLLCLRLLCLRGFFVRKLLCSRSEFLTNKLRMVCLCFNVDICLQFATAVSFKCTLNNNVGVWPHSASEVGNNKRCRQTGVPSLIIDQLRWSEHYHESTKDSVEVYYLKAVRLLDI